MTPRGAHRALLRASPPNHIPRRRAMCHSHSAMPPRAPQDSASRLRALAERLEEHARTPGDPIDSWPEEETTLTAIPESVSPTKLPLALALAVPPQQRAAVAITLACLVTVVALAAILSQTTLPAWLRALLPW